MPNKKMSIDERFTDLAIQYERYQECSTRKEKGKLRKEIMKVTGLARETMIRHMQKPPKRKKRRRQRERRYGAQVENVVHLVAKALDYPCAERLPGCRRLPHRHHWRP